MTVEHGDSILVLDDDPTMTLLLSKHLGGEHRVTTAACLADVRAELLLQHFDVAIIDLRLPDGAGDSLVPELHAAGTTVIIMTAFPEVASAVVAMRRGALDYLAKPFGLDEFDVVLAKALEHRGLLREVRAWRSQRRSTKPMERILGDSAAMVSLRKDIVWAASTNDTAVLIHGETGVGKELVAEAIHAASERCAAPMIRVDCSTLSPALLEFELFGHSTGAFSDVSEARAGLLEAADRGTFFMDEVADLPPPLQAHLLRVLDTRQLRRAGTNQVVRIEARFIAATNRDLSAMAAEGSFSQELLYKLDVIELTVPPLRERMGDVALLAQHFADVAVRRLGLEAQPLPPQVLGQRSAYAWPGNVRELQHVIERGVVRGHGHAFVLPELGPSTLAGSLVGTVSPDALPTLSAMTRTYAREVYERLGEDANRAAEVLRVSRGTLRELLN